MSEGDFQTLLDELTDAKNSLVRRMDTCQDSGCSV